MRHTPVESSNLRSVGYDPATETLEVTFKQSGTYSYSNVPESVYKSLMSASSHGEYFDRHIKKGSYPYKKIG
jgi:hypothetical protein